MLEILNTNLTLITQQRLYLRELHAIAIIMTSMKRTSDSIHGKQIELWKISSTGLWVSNHELLRMTHFIHVISDYFLMIIIAGSTNTKRTKLVKDEKYHNSKVSDCADWTPIDGFIAFPERLMQMLDSDEFSGIIYWSRYGDSFCINTKEFITKVLDVYFQGSRFECFVSKLNRWGFKRTYHPDFRAEIIGYQHPMFRKGRPELLTSFSNSKKLQSKTAISSVPNQGPLLPVMARHSNSQSTTEMTGGSQKFTEAPTKVVPAVAATCNTDTLQGQQQPMFQRSIVTQEASPINFRELLLHKVPQASIPMRQQQQQQIASMLASRHQQQQQQQLQQHQQRLRDCLSRVTIFPQSLPLSQNPTALELLRSANRLPLSLPILPNSRPASYEVLVSQAGQLHYPIRPFL